MAFSGDKEMEHLARIGLVFQEETEKKICFWKCFQIIYGRKSEVRTMKNINNLQIFLQILQVSTNRAHGDERLRKEVFTCTKSRAHESIKTPLSSTPMLSKVLS